MISDLFFNGKLKDVNNLIIYEEEFVLFYLSIRLKDREFFEKEDVESFLEELYGKENIKNNGIWRFCENNFILKDKVFAFNKIEENEDYKQNAILYFEEIQQLHNIDKNELYNKIEKEVFDTSKSFQERLKDCLTYYFYEPNCSLENKFILLYKYVQILKRYYELYRIIDNKIDKIPEMFNMVEITKLNMEEKQLSLLIFNNIFSLKNLKKMPINSLMCVFSKNIEDFVKEIGKYARSKDEIIKSIKERFNNTIKEEWAIVIQKRFEFETNKKRTLAEIGLELNITRERVRQIEKKTIYKLIECSEELNEIIYCFYKDINRENGSFITIEEFIKYIRDEQLARYLIIILSSEEIDINFDENFGILYNLKEVSIDKIIVEAKEEIKDIFPVSEITTFNKVQKIIIEDEYRLYQEKIYVKKSFNISDIYMNEIKENFINGYDIGSDDDYNKLIEFIKEKYGNIEVSSKRSVQGMIDRGEFIQVDRGKYLAREFAVTLPEKMIDKINDYIIENSPVVAYNMIYEKFKNELEKNGVENRFYLKGLIDEKLPEEFSTGRDFINTNSENVYTLYDVMPKIFREFEADFTMDDIKEKMPGLNDYNYENYIRAEEENGLIRMANRQYIYVDKLNITDEIKKELKEYVDSLFVALDSKLLTAQKIYASLAIKNKALLNKLHLTSRFGDFELYYLLKYLYKNDYYYSRPIISLEENFTTSAYVLAQEYARRLDKFNYGDVKSYLYKMNLGIIYSYLVFMEDMSESYVQINKDSMQKKEKLNLTEEKLKEIHDFIEMVVKEKELKTDNFDGYFMLPIIEKPWNKYLLVGIIRSYFSNEFEIENTTNYYDTTDFIVRRID